VELSVPTTAVDISATLDGRAWPGRVDAGAARYRLPARVETPRGGTSTVEVRYRIPVENGSYRLRLVPQPLAEDATALVSVRALDGWRLDGEGAHDGAWSWRGAFDRTHDVSVRLVRAGG
jgi:hypothetical protein